MSADEIATDSLEAKLLAEHPQLFTKTGLKIIESSYEANSFGNSLVMLKAPSFFLRIIRDRGQVFADIASSTPPVTYWRLEDVCALIEGKKVDTGLSLSTIILLLNQHLSALSNLMGPEYEQTKLALSRSAKPVRI